MKSATERTTAPSASGTGESSTGPITSPSATKPKRQWKKRGQGAQGEPVGEGDADAEPASDTEANASRRAIQTLENIAQTFSQMALRMERAQDPPDRDSGDESGDSQSRRQQRWGTLQSNHQSEEGP